jgi:methylenetetrahydrofolate reductase (NADH)
MQGWSLEATLPKPEEVAALRERLAPGTRVYLPALPHVSWTRLLQAVQLVARAGLEPVPHVAARNYESRAELAEFLAALREAGGGRRVLAIAGDREIPRGPLSSGLELIESGLLQEARVGAVDLPGYPNGHPRISYAVLAAALRAKIASAQQAGLQVEVLTQFGFDTKLLLSWLIELRYEFPELPLRVGLAGPASAGTLFQYALRCGVRTAVRGLGHGVRLLARSRQEQTPLPIMGALAEGWVQQKRGGLALHFYSFGGAVRTADWARALAASKADPGRSES